ncbi:hypothetical protein CG91_gp070 [Mycobacterium phage 39HC]|uniref:hypothetical protein n=1 Tax=Mycobacterium phage 39HC TaxID=1463809 RepID=UPI0003F21214|nr:hypothetical protein CG91_gp070 [Mycobacterium phage 39HC]AHJ88370.1 hypothetical protein 39HC_070 [Mycobacterium phage 39HC]AHJ88470.1 hypothetical protein 40BC_070 [Mycobacterium phage 40BC]
MASTSGSAAQHPSTQALLDHLRRDDITEASPELEWALARSVSYTGTEVADRLPNGGPELSAGLRKLIEAQDCFLRAAREHRRLAERPSVGEA